MKIGLLGGTFNPVHLGHLLLADEAREKLGLGKVVLIPANLPPHKLNDEIAPSLERLRMARLAIKGNKSFSVSDMEIRRKGRSFTIDTIKEFSRLCPKDELYFIIGSDLLTYLDEWKDLPQIVSMVKFIVATRPGYALEKIPSYITTMPIRAIDISGFEIRQRIREGRSFRYLVPESVFNYINRKRLYR